LAFKSPDGLHWTPISDRPVITNGAFDSQNLAFWDPVRGQYRAYWRYFTKGVTTGEEWKPGGVRAIRTATSKDFLNWENEADLTYVDSPREQLYTNQIKPYHRAPHILIGFPTRYIDRGWSDSMRALPEPERRQWRARAQQRYGTALTEGLLMSSRDGVNFHRWNEAFLRPGIERGDAWHYGQQYIGWHLVETKSALQRAPNELSLYASESYWHDEGSALRRYTLRLDGFVSASAGWNGGRLLTRPLVFTGQQLEINFATSAAGSLRIELQDHSGKPIEGFALTDCPEIFGDSVARVVKWNGGADLSALTGNPVRLLFELKDADLYSFQFRDHADEVAKLDPETRQRCMRVLDEGMRADDFWPAIHAAEALTLGGQGELVRAFLESKLRAETDDQKRCGLARELVRAGNRQRSSVIMDILSGADPHGHVHAAESLYKVGWIGDSAPLKRAFADTDNVRLRLMAAAALARHGQGSVRAEAFNFLRENLRSESDPEVFRLSAWVLGRIGADKDRSLIRSRLEDADENKLVLAFLQHALAALGDPEGQQALLRNLESSDPAVRTYAAVFAGESGISQAAPFLIRQLDDESLDARIRAAQALLLLAQQPTNNISR
jgi:thioredoxin-like negative regulator of GroEL